MWSTDTNPVSHTVSEILSLKYFGFVTLTLWGSCDVIGHVIMRSAVGSFLYVAHWQWHQPSISHRYWDIVRYLLHKHIPSVA